MSKDNSINLMTFFKELAAIQKLLFKLSDEDKKEESFNEDFTENEISANQNKTILKIQAIFKTLEMLSKLTILPPEKQSVLLPQSITKISHRFVFFGTIEPKEAPQKPALKINFPSPH